jgi:NADP-dependent 3-hydroxy acid dehydrogenase YdfG
MRYPKLQDKIAIVTGASRGIGRATAISLAQAGAHLALGARDASALEETASLVHSAGREALALVTDVTSQPQVEALVAQTLQRWGRVDILVANAGQYLRCPISELDIDLLQASMAINFYGSIYAVLAVLPHMRAAQSGHIVLVSSMDGKKGIPPDAPYAAAKFALAGFGEVLRQELAPQGVYTTLVFPGRVDTDFIQGLKFHPLSAPIPAQAVATAILNAISQRKAEVVVPPLARLLQFGRCTRSAWMAGKNRWISSILV